MKELDTRLGGTTVVTRAQVLEAGGTDAMIAARLRASWWEPIHAGVYRRGPRSGQWLEELDAALKAAGPRAAVSHRAAFVLWGLDGLTARLREITAKLNAVLLDVEQLLDEIGRRRPTTPAPAAGDEIVEGIVRALIVAKELEPGGADVARDIIRARLAQRPAEKEKP